MRARPDATFAVLVAVAGLAAVAVGSSVAALGGGGAEGLGAMVAGWVSACILFVRETPNVPAPVLLIVVVVSASTLSFFVTLLRIVVEQRLFRRLVRAAHSERLFGERVLVLPSRRSAAFCSGLLRPQVYVTEALVRALEPVELEAVVRHEAAHAVAHAPVKSLLARVLARTFFWLPTLRDLEAKFSLTAEFAADEAAIRATSPRAVAAALAQMLDAYSPVIGFANVADARVEKLLDPAAATPSLISRIRLLVTAGALGGVVALAAVRPELGAVERAHLEALAGSALLHRLLWERLAIVAAISSIAVVAHRRRRAR